MNDEQDTNENPLEDAAAEMSAGLSGTVVEIEQTSKSRVEGGQVRMTDSAAKSVEASALHMEDSAAGLVRSGSVDVTDGAIGVAVASQMNVRESSSLVSVAKMMDAEDVRSLVIVASHVNGKVESVFTPLTALAAGAGLAFGLIIFARALAWLATRPFRGLRRIDGNGSS